MRQCRHWDVARVFCGVISRHCRAFFPFFRLPHGYQHARRHRRKTVNLTHRRRDQQRQIISGEFSKMFSRSRLVSASTWASLLSGLLAAGNLPAQSVKDAYVQDQRGVIVRNAGFGDAKLGNLCWRTGFWTPALAIAECDPDIAPRAVPATNRPAQTSLGKPRLHWSNHHTSTPITL